MLQNFKKFGGKNPANSAMNFIPHRMQHSEGPRTNGYEKLLTVENMNRHVRVMQYAVRGPIVNRAMELHNELRSGVKKPFKEIIFANLGDAHALAQSPITFTRQVLALLSYPPLIDKSDFPADVKDKAKGILAACKGQSSGAYTDSIGIELIRKHVAQFIQRRDGGIQADPDNIMLCAGASEGIRNCLKLFESCGKDDKPPTILVPIPQYPLYSATLAEFNIHQTGYYLNEFRNWSLDVPELERVTIDARGGYHPRAIVVINPGNPTGQVLTRKNIEDVIKFAYAERLFILADEVYQGNVYEKDSKFVSFKKVMREMGEPYNQMELASFHSASKGVSGECGLRGGYTEFVNLDPEVRAMLVKSVSARLCPTTLGQATMDCIVDPPKEGDPSYKLYHEEKTAILNSFRERAKLVTDTFNAIPGIKCNPVQGALYAFPQIAMPNAAVDDANSKREYPDVIYAFELLETTGMCVVPGSGFGQLPGTFHIRTTILPQPEKLKLMLENFKNFHMQFLKKYDVR